MLKIGLVTMVLGWSACSEAAPVQFFTDSADFKLVMENKKSPEAIVSATNSLIFKTMGLSPSLLLVPAMRTESFLDNEQGTCTFFKLKTAERAEKYLFSYPTDIFLSAKLYQLSSSPPISDTFLDQQGGLKSLSGFFNQKDNNSFLLLMQGKSFGVELDEQIRHINPSSVYFLTAEDPHDAYTNIFIKKRSDFIITYPSVLERYAKQGIEFRSYSLPKAKQFISGRIMCNDRPASKAFIASTNNVIKQLYQTDAFLQAILKYTPSADHQHVKDILLNKLVPETL